MTDPYIGCTLSNRYQLIELLGQGSMGRVYGARDRLLGGVPVAVKFLAQTLLNQRMKERFDREATTCALLGSKSRHIVRVLDSGVNDEGIPFYVMEYLEGESLSDVISRHPISLPRFLSLSRQICLGLQCAHQGIQIGSEIFPIVHRDIKPSNILITQDDSGEVAKILDFGIAKLLQADSGNTNCFMGTLAYSSPEQMEGQELDARSDIYSLGVMMFQMLTGRMPLHADTHNFGGWYKTHQFQEPRSFAAANSNVNIPKALESLVMSCLAKRPEDRPQNAAEVIRALEPLDQRFQVGRELGQRIGGVLDSARIKPPLPQAPATLTPQDICRLSAWPSDKPIADIVFSRALPTNRDPLATLWVMQSKQELQKRSVCTRYNQFLFLQSPHPVMLWLTVLYNRAHGPRWLPCYLDMKTQQGQRLTRLLGQTGQYHILFFAKEDPQRCANVMTSTIAPAQCRLLKEWATMAQLAPATTQFQVSRSLLREELENNKPKILMRLESLYADEEADLSG